MYKAELNGKEYPLRFNMAAFEMIEASFGGIDKMYEGLQDSSKSVWTMVELITVFINGYRKERGERTLTHDWVAGNLQPWQILELRETIAGVLNEGMHARTKTDLDDEEHDEVLEEVQKKRAEP